GGGETVLHSAESPTDGRAGRGRTSDLHRNQDRHHDSGRDRRNGPARAGLRPCAEEVQHGDRRDDDARQTTIAGAHLGGESHRRALDRLLVEGDWRWVYGDRESEVKRPVIPK